MQLITPKSFHPMILFWIAVAAGICTLYGSLLLATLLVAYTLYGYLLPKYLEYLGARLSVRLVETVRAFRDDPLLIPFEIHNPTRFSLGKVTVSGLLGNKSGSRTRAASFGVNMSLFRVRPASRFKSTSRQPNGARSGFSRLIS